MDKKTSVLLASPIVLDCKPGQYAWHRCFPNQQFNLHSLHTPRVSIGDVRPHLQEVVADAAHYPSPVLAVGWCHSVNECVTNSGGTIICVAGLDKIVGVTGKGSLVVFMHSNHSLRHFDIVPACTNLRRLLNRAFAFAAGLK